MAHSLKLISFLLLCTFSSVLKAALPAPFSCEIRSEVDVNKLAPELKQWLLLFDLSQGFLNETTTIKISEPSFENTYWKSFREIKSKVQNCDEMLAFWQRFGEGIENYFDQSEPLSADTSALEASVFVFEMNKRNKLFIPESGFIPRVILQKIAFDGVRPWWRVKISGQHDQRVLEVPHYYPQGGPLAALISYEILRKWHSDFPRDFWHKDVLLTEQRAQMLSLSFPWAKPLFDFIVKLPPRNKLSNWLSFFCILLTLYLGLKLIRAVFQGLSPKKQK